MQLILWLFFFQAIPGCEVVDSKLCYADGICFVDYYPKHRPYKTFNVAISTGPITIPKYDCYDTWVSSRAFVGVKHE